MTESLASREDKHLDADFGRLRQQLLRPFRALLVVAPRPSRARLPIPVRTIVAGTQVILATAPGVSNEGGSSPLLALVSAVSWPWVSAWGSLEPSRPGGENAQKTRKNGEKMGEIWPKKCEQGRERRDHLGGCPNAAAVEHAPLQRRGAGVRGRRLLPEGDPPPGDPSSPLLVHTS